MIKIKYFLLVLILAIGFLLRFYRLNEWLYFNMDEERDAFIVKRILVNHHFTLIGGSVPGGIYLGPLFYYLSAIPLSLFKLNPLGLGVTASILGVFSIWLIFYIGEQLFNSRVAILTACLFATSYLNVIYNRHFWPLTPAPIVAMLTYLSLYKIIIVKKLNFSYLLAGALIVGMQSDPSNFTLMILTIVSWIFFKLPVKVREIKQAILLIIVSNLPLLLFDLRHNFLNSRALLQLLSFKGGNIGAFNFDGLINVVRPMPQTFSRLIYTFGTLDISKQLTPCLKYENLRETNVPTLLTVIGFVVLGLFLYKGLGNIAKDKRKTGLSLISLHMLITLAGITFFSLVFPSYMREYFLAVLFPAFFLILGLSLDFLIQNKLTFTALFLIILIMFFNIRAVLKSGNFLGFSNKLKAVDYALTVIKDRPFFIWSLSSCFKYNGLRYLFYYSGREPDTSFMDPFYGWLYDKAPATQDPKIGAVFVSHDQDESWEFWQQYRQYEQKILNRIFFGNLEVMIIDNDK